MYPTLAMPRTLAPQSLAPPRLAPPRLAPPRLAPPRLAPPRLAPRRSAPPRLAPPRLAPPRLAPRRAAPRRSAPLRLAPCLTAISTATRQDSASTPNRTAPEKRFLISIFIGPSSTRRLAAARAPPPSRPARRRTRRTDSRARRGARGRRRSCPHLALDPEDRERAADHPRLRDGRHRQDDLGKVLAAHENTVRPRAAVRSSCELADDLGIRGHRLVRRRVPRVVRLSPLASSRTWMMTGRRVRRLIAFPTRG